MTIIDRIEEDECIKRMLNEEAERKNNELKKELDIRDGKYVDKSIFPKNDFIYGKEVYPFGSNNIG